LIIPLEFARKILKPIQDILQQVITLSWNDYHDDKLYSQAMRLRHTPRTRANIVWDHMVFYAKQLLADVNGIRFYEEEELFLVYYKETVALRFKKFNDDKHSCNIQTEQTKIFFGQEDLPYMPAKISRLVVGYQLNLMQNDIKSILVTCPIGQKRNAWEWGLSDEATSEQVDILPIRPQKPPVQPHVQPGTPKRVVIRGEQIDPKLEKRNE
jgi:hypothetical protein